MVQRNFFLIKRFSFFIQVIVSGGISSDLIILDDCLTLNLNSNVWTATTNLLQPRADHVMIQINSNELLIVGKVSKKKGYDLIMACCLISVRSWNFKHGGSLKASFLAKNQHAIKEKSLKKSYE